jgi:glyoxylase I family protein
MAHVDYVLAVVAMSDITAGRAWYTSLFGREPDNSPMSNLVELQVTDGGWGR